MIETLYSVPLLRDSPKSPSTKSFVPDQQLPSCLIPSHNKLPRIDHQFSNWIVVSQSNVAPSLFAFKTLPDRLGGRIVFVRVYSGVIMSGHRLFNSNQSTWETITGIFRVKADRYIKVNKLAVG